MLHLNIFPRCDPSTSLSRDMISIYSLCSYARWAHSQATWLKGTLLARTRIYPFDAPSHSWAHKETDSCLRVEGIRGRTVFSVNKNGYGNAIYVDLETVSNKCSCKQRIGMADTGANPTWLSVNNRNKSLPNWVPPQLPHRLVNIDGVMRQPTCSRWSAARMALRSFSCNIHSSALCGIRKRKAL